MKKKRILFLLPASDETSSGVGLATSRLMTLLKNLGYETEILFLKKKNYNKVSNIWETFTKYFFITNRRKVTNIEKHRLYNKIKVLNPDIIFIPSVLESFYSVAIALKNKYGISVVSFPHGLLKVTETQLRAQKILFYLIKKMSNSTMTIFLNEEEYLHAKQLGYSGRHAIIPNFMAPPIVLSKTDETKDLLFIGRINADKGIFILLEAWNRYLKNSKNKAFNRLVVRGHGNKKQLLTFKNIIQYYNLAPTIDYSEFSPQYEIKKLLNTSRALILPTKVEGQSLVIIEAWSHFLPIITTDAAGYANDCYKDTYIKIEPTVEGIYNGLLKFDCLDGKVINKIIHNGLSSLNRWHTEKIIQNQYKKLLKGLSSKENLT